MDKELGTLIGEEVVDVRIVDVGSPCLRERGAVVHGAWVDDAHVAIALVEVVPRDCSWVSQVSRVLRLLSGNLVLTVLCT